VTERDRDIKTMLLGIFVGALTIGAAVWAIVHSMRKTLQGAAGQLPAGSQPINIYNNIGGYGQGQGFVQPIQPSQITDRMQLADGTSLATKTGTLTLSTSDARRVFQAPSKGSMWKVSLHALGPPGGFAAFAVDTTPSANGSESIVIPTGSATELRIGPRQIISGRALNANTTISYTASAELV